MSIRTDTARAAVTPMLGLNPSGTVAGIAPCTNTTGVSPDTFARSTHVEARAAKRPEQSS